MARKIALTAALEQAIVTAIAGGVRYYEACLLAGVATSTATEWRERGEGIHSARPSTPQLAAFAAAVKKAEAQDEVRRLLRINQAGQGGAIIYERTLTHPDGRIEREVKRTAPQWQADAWHLERKYPDRYGRRMQADLRVQVNEVVREVAAEVGIDPEALMREAQDYLREYNARHGH